MLDFPLGLDALRIIEAYRTDFWTVILHFFTFMGEKEGYILIIVGVYMMYDKKLAVRLAVIAISTRAINQLLKAIIANPRPFVLEGTYLQHWEVSAEYAHAAAFEFSTPSGHAMGSVPFFGYLFHAFRNPYFRLMMIACIFLIGFSRPYLGVHYLEDISLGWLLGWIILVGTLKYEGVISKRWDDLNLIQISLIAVGFSLLCWLIAFYIQGGEIANLSLDYVGNLGFLLGVLIGARLEKIRLDFDPKSKSVYMKLIRFLLTITLVLLPLFLLKKLPFIDWTDPSYINQFFQYIRYAIVAFMGIYIAPWLCIKLRLLS